METESLKDARERVRRRFGDAVSRKATPEFCAAFGRSEIGASAGVARSRGYELEQMVVSNVLDVAAPKSIVLEFGTSANDESPKKIRPAQRSSTSLAAPETRAADSLTQDPYLGRQHRVHEARDEFFKKVADVRLEIERGARNFHRPGPEGSISPQLPSDIAELCWLNASIRTWTDPRSLAEVASDPAIDKVDLPRRLSPERTDIGTVSDVPNYRTESTASGKGIKVAVIDSEIAKNHPAFQDRVIPQQNYSREPWGNPGNHATAVAGIIGGRDVDFSGIAPDVTIYNYKVFTTNRFLSGDDFDGALALQRALEDGAHIANCSWGAGPAADGKSREAKACDVAWNLGMVIVKSAGNTGPKPKTLTSPADAEGIIVVGATDLLGKSVAPYSSRGPTIDGRHRPHILGVGGTNVAGIFSSLAAGGYGDCGAGTSFAAPYITGILALLLETSADRSPGNIRTTLLSLATKITNATADAQGAGFVSLKRQH